MKTRTCPVCGNQYSRSSEKAPWAATCSRACGAALRYGDPTARFWSNVDQSGGEDACWLWKRSGVNGYGRVGWNGKNELAHRVAWAITHDGEMPEKDVLHSCDAPACCNPRHLFLGDHVDNMADMVAKDRSNKPAGHKNGRAVLTEDDVRRIRAELELGRTQQSLADEYGVGQPTISAIKRGVRWSHIK